MRKDSLFYFVLQYVVFTLLYLRKLLSWEHGNFLLYIIYLIYVSDPKIDADLDPGHFIFSILYL